MKFFALLSAIFLIHTVHGAAVRRDSKLGVTHDQLVGCWRVEYKDRRSDEIYYEDGTYTGSVSKDGVVYFEYAGKWSLDGNNLNYEYTKSSLAGVLPGKTGQDRIVEIAKDHYIYENRSGVRKKRFRVELGRSASVGQQSQSRAMSLGGRACGDIRSGLEYGKRNVF